MEKTSKITRTIFKNEWTSPQGQKIYYHDVELENGDKGSIGAKEQMPSKLNPNQELTYTIEGNKIKAVVPKPSFGGGGKGYTAPDPKVQMISFSMSYAKDLIVGSKVDIKDLEITFDRIYKAMTSKLS